MSKLRTYSDEELTAYLDGELDALRCRELEADLKQDGQLRGRLEALSVDTDSVRQSFEQLLALSPAPPSFLDGTRPAQSRMSSTAASFVTVVALTCLLLGAGAGWLYRGSENRTWQAFAAAYHALYVNRTLSGVNNNSQIALGELQRVSDALGKDLRLGDLQRSRQLDYKRAQVLGFQGRPLVQLAFLSKVGAPIALCIIRSQDKSE
ncbi:MAG: anti-sigma factor family protein, partial [Hyphomicrobiaceae bacterium]